MHRRSSEGPLWLTDWGYCQNPAYHSFSLILDTQHEAWWSSYPITNSQMFLQCTKGHWMGCFDWYTEVSHIYDVLLESCISQTARCSHSMHWRSLQVPLWLMHWGYTYTVYGVLLEWCISQLFIDVRYSKRSLVVFSSYHKQRMVHSMYQRSLEGLLWLMYWCYKYIWCTVAILPILAFQWCRILQRTLSGPLIISQTAGWSIWCTRNHQQGCFN